MKRCRDRCFSTDRPPAMILYRGMGPEEDLKGFEEFFVPRATLGNPSGFLSLSRVL